MLECDARVVVDEDAGVVAHSADFFGDALLPRAFAFPGFSGFDRRVVPVLCKPRRALPTVVVAHLAAQRPHLRGVGSPVVAAPGDDVRRACGLDAAGDDGHLQPLSGLRAMPRTLSMM